jgi:predicted nucleic acid-binding protein
VEFIDTNVLIYAHDRSAVRKQVVARELVRRLTADGDGGMSIQVLSEFYAVTTRKRMLSDTHAESVITDFGIWSIHCPNHSDLLRACELCRRFGISWWDALIVNSAMELGCETLWTEDLNDGQQFGGVTVRNPFTA